MSVAARLAVLLSVLAVLVVGPTAPTAEGATVAVAVGNYWFCDSSGGACSTNISVGDTVRWEFSGSCGIYAVACHTTTDCGADCATPTGSPLWGGTLLNGGGTFEFTFDEAGTYPYYCTIHGASIMSGEIVVGGAVGGIAELPRLDGGQAEVAETPLQQPDSSSGSVVALAVVVAAAVAMLTLAGAAWYARRRWLL